MFAGVRRGICTRRAGFSLQAQAKNDPFGAERERQEKVVMSALIRNLDDFQQFSQAALKTFERNGVKTLQDFVKARPNFIIYVLANDSFKSVYQVQQFKKKLVSDSAPSLVNGEAAADTFQASVPTGVLGLDQILGGSGLRARLIHEVYGTSGVGKTQLCMFLSASLASKVINIKWFYTITFCF